MIVTRKRIAVLMSVHNRSEVTRRCLESLHAAADSASHLHVKVFMTDDGCTDDTVAQARAASPEIEIIRGSGTLYWAAGMAEAESRALLWAPDYFLWLNDDVILEEDAFTELVRTAVDPAPGIAVGATRDPDDGLISYGGCRVHKRHPMKLARLAKSHDVQRADTFEGNVILIPRTVHERVGLIDREFGHAYADLDYGLRARRAGIEVRQAPDFVGECRRNPRSGIDVRQPLDRAKFSGGLRGRWRASQDPITGLPWRCQIRYLRRHAGPEWPLYAGWSMARRLLRA